MTGINLNLPVLDEIKSRLEVIDSKLDSIKQNDPLNANWLNSKESAKALGITTRTLQTYRDQGRIPFSQFGREVRYRADDIQQFLMDHYVKAQNQGGLGHE